MKWLADLLENHPELALDSYDDQARGVELIRAELAKRIEELRPFMLVALRGACRLAREQHVVTSTADYKAFADKLHALVFATLESYLLEIDTRGPTAKLEVAHP